jgi:hypothetical protein
MERAVVISAPDSSAILKGLLLHGQQEFGAETQFAVIANSL